MSRTEPIPMPEAAAPPPVPRTSVARPSRTFVGAATGLLSAAVALGVAHLTAGFAGGSSSPMIAVGSVAIDAAPESVKSFAIRTFGTHDKAALLIGIATILGIVAIVLGVASLRRPGIGIAGLLAFGALGAVAAISRPANGWTAALPSVVGTAAGLVAFRWIRHAAGLDAAGPGGTLAAHEPARPGEQRGSQAERESQREVASEPGPRPGGEPHPYDRRRFLLSGAALAGLAAVTGSIGRFLVQRADADASRAAVRLPTPGNAAAAPGGADLRVPGLSPFITPNDRFYRVDTALLVPAVDADSWKLTVHGMVQHELTIDYEELLARPLIERDITLTCVSNPVGGPYIGNARWIGAPLKDLLEEAGIDPGADQIVSRSADGFTAGTPTALAMDGRDSMLAIAMNGEPLPLAHGFPVRLIVPGLYGFVSATKWLVDLELSTFDSFDAYWVRRGWSQQAPIKTESRIDTPKAFADLAAGEVTVAGVAWAQHRGIDRVEVSIDDGEWNAARLAVQDTVDTWRQWVYRWTATSGSHTISVRATDATGMTQTPERVEPFPDGATGEHSILVNVA
jgi:DMSO/TMAO reductase YedYZ molybdopterin-dependent catalytic subunit